MHFYSLSDIYLCVICWSLLVSAYLILLIGRLSLIWLSTAFFFKITLIVRDLSSLPTGREVEIRLLGMQLTLSNPLSPALMQMSHRTEHVS